MSSLQSAGEGEQFAFPTLELRGKVLRCLITIAASALVLAACGSTEETTSDHTPDSAAMADDADEDEDHDDKDHDDEESNGLGSHEHGSAELSVAWIGSDVAIDLISPTQNVFGFEHEPETDEDRAIETDRTEAITAIGLVTLNDEAGCEPTEPATIEIEREGSHSEVTVSWAFSCANPDDVTNIDLAPLFAEFPGFEDIDAEWVSATNQSSAELSPEEPMLSLES